MTFLLVYNTHTPEEHRTFARRLAEQMGKQYVETGSIPDDVETFCDDNGIDMLFISCSNSRNEVQRWLDRCRTLRLPYVFLTGTMTKVQPVSRILMPVTLLEEEVHKAQTAAHISRFTGAHIILLRAHDYGSKARQNTQKIITLLDKFSLSYEEHEARKDSFAITRELSDRQREFVPDLLILTASRDYGLDDIVFGPPERHAIRRSTVPVLLLNPRGDLYALCD